MVPRCLEVRSVARAAVAILATLVLSASLVACTDEGHGVAATQSTVTSPTASPTIVDGAACPPAPTELGLPAGAGCASWALGSFERNETAQRLLVYADLDEQRMPVRWRVRVTRAEGEPLDEPLGFGSGSSYPLVLGAANADMRGPDEAFVKVLTHSYHSGKTHEVAIFGVRAGRVFTVEADGEPLLFQVGGVSYFGAGAECRDVDRDGIPEFLVLRVDGVFGEIQKWSERIFSWRGRSLTLTRERRGRFAKTGYHDPLLWRFYSLRCFAFDPPFPFTRG